MALSPPRIAVFLIIAGLPMYYFWPSIILLGDYGTLVSIFITILTLATTFIAQLVVLAWQTIRPLQGIDRRRNTRLWQGAFAAVALMLVLTFTGLPTRAILIAHTPLFARATRDVVPGSQLPAARRVRYAGIFELTISTDRGGVAIKPNPWWGFGASEGYVAWDADGKRGMVWNTAGEGRLIGKWIWWDIE